MSGMGAEEEIEIPGSGENRASTMSPIPFTHRPNVSNPGPRLDKEAGPNTLTTELALFLSIKSHQSFFTLSYIRETLAENLRR